MTAVHTALQVGDPAPDFSLLSTSGQQVTLSSLRGSQHVLLCFFPFAFSSVCTEEFCDLRDAYEQFAGKEVTVFPISVDSTDALKEFKAKHGMRVELLSDFGRRVCAAYGTLWQDKGFSNRAYFLIDKTGTLRWAQVEPNPGSKRTNDEIFAELAKLS